MEILTNLLLSPNKKTGKSESASWEWIEIDGGLKENYQMTFHASRNDTKNIFQLLEFPEENYCRKKIRRWKVRMRGVLSTHKWIFVIALDKRVFKPSLPMKGY